MSTCIQQEAKRKEELSAAKSKMDQMMEALKEEYRADLKKKEDDIHALQDDVRNLKRTADRLKVIVTEALSSPWQWKG